VGEGYRRGCSCILVGPQGSPSQTLGWWTSGVTRGATRHMVNTYPCLRVSMATPECGCVRRSGSRGLHDQEEVGSWSLAGLLRGGALGFL
jgi:hypothetical protein